MFRIDGSRSFESELATALLESSDLAIGADEELCCTIYRQDPVDEYLFLLAHAGLRQPEPMYGPKVYDDARKSLGRIPAGVAKEARKKNSWDFVSREQPKWFAVFKPEQPNPRWAIYLNGRGSDSGALERFRRQVLPPLERILDETTKGDQPLYPRLIFVGRRVQNRLNRKYAQAGRSADSKKLAVRFAEAVREELRKCGPGGAPIDEKIRVGVYLPNKNRGWELHGDAPQDHFDFTIGEEMTGASVSDGVGGFAWVQRSTRPVLVSADKASDVWKRRLGVCGPRISDYCETGSIGLVPILSPWDTTRCFGILVLAGSEADTICPGFLYLGSRLTLTLARHLAPPESSLPAIDKDAEREVFFSYCEKDTAEVREVAEKLRGSAGINPWLYSDQDDTGGEDVPDIIENAIERSRVAAVFLGNHGQESWRKEELGLLKLRKVEGKGRIIPVILMSCKKSEAELKNEVGSLAIADWIDLRAEGGTEKLKNSVLKGLSSP